MANTIQFKRNTAVVDGSTVSVVGQPLFEYLTNGTRANLYMGYDNGTAKALRVGAIVDVEDLATNSDDRIPTQKAVKTYVDAQSHTDTVGSLTDVTITSSAASELLFTTGANTWVNYTLAEAGIGAATAVATNATNIATNATNISSNDTDIATNATAIGLRATLASPTFTGTPLAPTAAEDTNTTQIATTAYVQTEISGFGASDITMDGTTNNGIVTYGGTDNIDVESVWTILTNNLQGESTSSNYPRITLTQTGTGANGPSILFDTKTTGADDALLGACYFYGDDESGNASQLYAQIKAKIKDATHGTERGSLEFLVAEYDGTCTTSGLTIHGAAADGEIDVDIGAGVNSTTTIAGDLTVNGTTTTINTTTVEVEDNILQLNTTQASPDTATAATSGISCYRGAAVTAASLIFDDADDTWDLTNHLTVAGTVTGNAFAGDLTGDVTGNADTATNLTASTSVAVALGTIELGHATDTTIARASAGEITVEGTAILKSGGALGTPSGGTLTNCTGYDGTIDGGSY